MYRQRRDNPAEANVLLNENIYLRREKRYFMKPLFLQYPNCDTSRRAAKWLKAHHVDVDSRNIVTENPRVEELIEWIGRSGLPVRKFFNVSGVKYKELNLKERVKTAPDEELVALLASDGKLVKRPLLITGERVLVGFVEKEWIDLLE